MSQPIAKDRAGEVPATVHFDEGIALDDGPALAIPLRQPTSRFDAFEVALVIAVVGDHHAPEVAVSRFEMRVLVIGHAKLDGEIGEKARLQRMHIQLIEFAFHAQHVDQVLLVAEVAHGRADPHFQQSSTVRTFPPASMTCGPMKSWFDSQCTMRLV